MGIFIFFRKTTSEEKLNRLLSLSQEVDRKRIIKILNFLLKNPMFDGQINGRFYFLIQNREISISKENVQLNDERFKFSITSTMDNRETSLVLDIPEIGNWELCCVIKNNKKGEKIQLSPNKIGGKILKLFDKAKEKVFSNTKFLSS